MQVEYIKDLAAHFVAGKLSSTALKAMGNEEAIEALTRVRGIGEWSAHMFLLFGLNRADVLPWGDLGIRKATVVVYGSGRKALPDREELERRAAKWAPYRSLASWALWRALDGGTSQKSNEKVSSTPGSSK